jgi:transposase
VPTTSPLPPKQAAVDEELLPLVHQLRQLTPQLARLLRERRDDEHPDPHQRADDEEIDRQDGDAARDAVADERVAATFDRADERRQSDGHERGDVNEQQHVPHEVGGPEQDERERGSGKRVADERARILAGSAHECWR